MKRLLVILALIVSVQSAKAQSHSVSLSWVLSSSTGVTSQNVYRGNCTGTVTSGTCSTDSTATFTKLSAGAGLGPAVTTFTDSTVAAGQSYIYYVTAVCPATGACQGESAPSSHVAATIPGNPPPPPTGLSITSVSLNVNGANETILARWTDTSNTQQHYAFTDGQLYRGQGLTSSASGSFAETLTVPAGTPITFLVCNAEGTCASQKAM